MGITAEECVLLDYSTVPFPFQHYYLLPYVSPSARDMEHKEEEEEEDRSIDRLLHDLDMYA